MKQSAAKTLGVAFVGAAFAAAAAGSASAAVAPANPEVAGTLDSVSRTLPLENVTSTLPADAHNSVSAGQTALGSQAAGLPGNVGSTMSKALPTGHAANPVGSLIGGLPAGGATGGALPGGALPGLGR